MDNQKKEGKEKEEVDILQLVIEAGIPVQILEIEQREESFPILWIGSREILEVDDGNQ